MSKQNKLVTLCDLDGYYHVDDLITMLQIYKAKYSETGHYNLHVEVKEDSYDSSCHYLVLTGTRLETDAEYLERIAKEKIANDRKEEYDRKQYEILKGKFG